MQLSSTLTSNSSANRQNFRYTLSHFAVKANLKSTKITRLIVRIVNNEGTPGSQGEEGLKDSQAPQTFRRDDLNKKIADDTLLPPSMREPGANKMGAATENNTIHSDTVGLASSNNASSKKHADSEELKSDVLTQKIFKTDSSKTTTTTTTTTNKATSLSQIRREHPE